MKDQDENDERGGEERDLSRIFWNIPGRKVYGYMICNFFFFFL